MKRGERKKKNDRKQEEITLITLSGWFVNAANRLHAACTPNSN
jgi:hypothetical protein